jgi:hypothetical protein
VEAGFFDGDMLEAVDLFRIGYPEHRAGAAPFDDLLNSCAVGIAEELWDWEAGELGELRDFFVEGHLPEEVGGAGLHFGFGDGGVGLGGFVLRLLRSQRRSCDDGCEQQNGCDAKKHFQFAAVSLVGILREESTHVPFGHQSPL